MSTIIKKISRNSSFLISGVGNIARITFTSHKLLLQATNAEGNGIFYALKRVKTCLRSTMGSNRLHALILVPVHKNILDNINLADIVND